jgi:hypothetical protein
MSESKFSPNRTRTQARRGGQGPNLNQRRARDRSNGPWGSRLVNKPDSAFRYGFLDICGLPVDAYHAKHKLLTQCTTKHSIDLIGLSELNLNFPAITPSHQWMHRFPFQRTCSHYATNVHSTSKDRRLYGSTGFLTGQPSTSQKVEAKGNDPLGLRRWTWTLLNGRQGIKIRIIQGYRPVIDTTNKASSVYSQHERYFYDAGAYREPRNAFLDNLGQAIKTWQSDGNLIILGLDLNEDTGTAQPLLLFKNGAL